MIKDAVLSGIQDDFCGEKNRPGKWAALHSAAGSVEKIYACTKRDLSIDTIFHKAYVV
jgi:hypothetical protein